MSSSKDPPRASATLGTLARFDAVIARARIDRIAHLETAHPWPRFDNDTGHVMLAAGSPKKTITAALSAAVSGDTVQAAPGFYDAAKGADALVSGLGVRKGDLPGTLVAGARLAVRARPSAASKW